MRSWIAVIGVLVSGVGNGWGDTGDGGESAVTGWWVLYAVDTNNEHWHATVRVDEGEVGGDGLVSGEMVWDTPTDETPGFFGRAFFDGTYDPATRGVLMRGFELVEEDQKVGTSDYRATLAGGGDLLENGSWVGNVPNIIPSDFWVAVRSEVVAESGFGDGAQGWTGQTRWDGGETALVTGATGGELVAPAAYHGDWSWRGQVPTLLSIQVAWTGDGFPEAGPEVVLTGAGGEARFEVDYEEAFQSVPARSYLVPLRGDEWEWEAGTDWGALLAAVDGLKILPGRGAAGGGFLVGEVRVVRPVFRPAPMWVEWDFEGESLVAARGAGVMEGVSSTALGGWREREPEFVTVDAGGGEEGGILLPKVIGGNAFGTEDESGGLRMRVEGITPNGGGRWVNQYSVVWDLRLAGELYGEADFENLETFDWHKATGVRLFASRGSLLTVEFGQIISGAPDLNKPFSPQYEWEDPLVGAGTWHRVVVTVDEEARVVRAYVDGVVAFEGEALRTDAGWGLEEGIQEHLLPVMFGDVGFGGTDVELAGVAFVDMALSADQVGLLGDAGGGPILTPVFDVAFGIDAVDRPGSVTLGFDPYAGWRYALERSDDLCRWEVVEEITGDGGGRWQKVLTTDDGGAGFYRVRALVD